MTEHTDADERDVAVEMALASKRDELDETEQTAERLRREIAALEVQMTHADARGDDA